MKLLKCLILFLMINITLNAQDIRTPLSVQMKKLKNVEQGVKYLKLGNTYREGKNFHKAIEYLDKGMTITQSSPYWQAVGYEYLGYYYRDMGNNQESMSYFKKAKSIYDRILTQKDGSGKAIELSLNGDNMTHDFQNSDSKVKIAELNQTINELSQIIENQNNEITELKLKLSNINKPTTSPKSDVIKNTKSKKKSEKENKLIQNEIDKYSELLPINKKIYAYGIIGKNFYSNTLLETNTQYSVLATYALNKNYEIGAQISYSMLALNNTNSLSSSNDQWNTSLKASYKFWEWKRLNGLISVTADYNLNDFSSTDSTSLSQKADEKFANKDVRLGGLLGCRLMLSDNIGLFAEFAYKKSTKGDYDVQNLSCGFVTAF